MYKCISRGTHDQRHGAHERNTARHKRMRHVTHIQDIAATTRNYVYNLDIFPRLLFQQDPELVLNFLSAYIKEHYPAY